MAPKREQKRGEKKQKEGSFGRQPESPKTTPYPRRKKKNGTKLNSWARPTTTSFAHRHRNAVSGNNKESPTKTLKKNIPKRKATGVANYTMNKIPGKKKNQLKLPSSGGAKVGGVYSNPLLSNGTLGSALSKHGILLPYENTRRP